MRAPDPTAPIVLTAEQLGEISAVISNYYQRICELEDELKQQRRLADITGRRMARQRRHITDLIRLLVQANGGTRRQRAGAAGR